MKSINTLLAACLLTVAAVFGCSDVSLATARQRNAAPALANKDRIQPCHKNSRYWQYKGKPVLLLGGTNDDNLFQWTGSRLTEQLDLLKTVGGNYIRNTMSSRDPGNVWPFHKRKDGKYDLNRPGDEYWQRFENLLKLTSQRHIIVQIELWDRFDFTQANWNRNPYNPKNNINYTVEESGLKKVIKTHAGKNENAFFRSTPKLENNQVVLQYQRMQVDRMLSISLKYGNVLYCMNNETSEAAEWGAYWSHYIKNKASKAGVEVHTTEMWDEYDLMHDHHKRTYDHPETYSFCDISQNTHNRGQKHWDNIEKVRAYLDPIRPMNNVKIYGSDEPYRNAPPGARDGVGGRYGRDYDALERFWRNIFGGLASARFHRPSSGLGLTDKAQANIRSLRMLTDSMDIFTCTAHNNLLSDRKPNEAYCLANPGKEYAVYFPDGGKVKLDISDVRGKLKARWLNIAQSRWTKEKTLKGGGIVALTPPGTRQWVILLTKDAVLPYDNTNPVIYDNDFTNDYVDWYLMALATAGDIKYLGISTSSSVAPYNEHMPAKDLAAHVAKRREIVRRGRNSGFRHIPDPIPGTKGNLIKPASGKIEDTRPLGSPGSRRIVEQAGKATPAKPLVVCVGGPLTVVADAYLLDNSIADKVVVAWLDNHNKGMTGFNGWSDGWAAFIVLEKIRLVQFTVQTRPFPRVPKSRLLTLPDTEAREYMLALQTDVVAPEGDADGPPAISLMRPDYVRSAKRVSFGGWTTRHGHEMPMFRDDPNGRAIVVTSVDRKVATEEWWRAMMNPVIWKAAPVAANKDRIQPCHKNPRYWQYKGKPVLLLSGTKDDSLFQIPDLKEHLDLLKSVGGNYIRNTMSSRPDFGFEVQPYKKSADGRYDLDQWNDEYWNRFENMLRLTAERDIIVQIEVWAFHDFNKRFWDRHPLQPGNNVNYSTSNTSLKADYGNIGKKKHDFFFTVPKLNNDTIALKYQQKFVDKILSYTLSCNHALYCMTNEIHPNYSPEWGWYWSKYIKARAASAGVTVYTSEMYWEIDLKKPQQRDSLDRPEIFPYFEASQNSAAFGRKNWDNLQFAYNYLSKKPRPINHTKIYGADTGSWEKSTTRHACECFWRNIIGGSASSRFHRPRWGLGLGEEAQAHIKSMRLLTARFDIFNAVPDSKSRLLSNCGDNEAYLACVPGKQYAVYFPDGGAVDLDLSEAKGSFIIRWLDIAKSQWQSCRRAKVVKGGQKVSLHAPDRGHWAVLIERRRI